MTGKYLTRTIRTTLIAVFTFQLLSTVERQVFDFLGYMWAPIIGNFFQIIAVILGLFGACQHYRSFVVVYAVWSLLWLGWNIFVICLYLEVGILNRDGVLAHWQSIRATPHQSGSSQEGDPRSMPQSPHMIRMRRRGPENRERYILTIGTESKSWWLEHGIGCNVTNSTWILSPSPAQDSSRPIPPEEFVEGCILQYYYVEVIHAAVQVLLSLVGLVVAFVIIYTSLEEEDASIPANDELEFVMIRSRTATNNAYSHNNNNNNSTTTTSNFDNMAFHSDSNNDDDGGDFRAYRLPPPARHFEHPPSYDTTMRNNTPTDAETRAANLYYAADRQSVRSKASNRSRRSASQQRGGNQASSRSRRSTRDRDVRQDLPWVQIALSDSGSVV